MEAVPLVTALKPVMVRGSPSASLSLAIRLARLIEIAVSSVVVALSATARGGVLIA